MLPCEECNAFLSIWVECLRPVERKRNAIFAISLGIRSLCETFFPLLSCISLHAFIAALSILDFVIKYFYSFWLAWVHSDFKVMSCTDMWFLKGGYLNTNQVSNTIKIFLCSRWTLRVGVRNGILKYCERKYTVPNTLW